MRQVLVNILFIFFSFGLYAQQDSITSIAEVKVYSRFSPKDQIGYSIQTIPDSILQSGVKNFADLLKKTANIYIKQQGNAMVASIAMRGTGASHTAVYWNGISINSSLNGQTDFNLINPFLYHSVQIRKGGGSVLLGSGAIGGAINLENIFNFHAKTTGLINGSIGSYKTYLVSALAQHSTRKFALQLGLNRIESQNDYPYLGTSKFNKNGALTNYQFRAGIAYNVSENNQISYQNRIVDSNRDTSGTLTSTNNANLVYRTDNHLLKWVYKHTGFNGVLKTAYLKERYIYYFDKDYPDHYSDNHSEQWIANYTADYRLYPKINIVSGINYQILQGGGTNINVQRQNNLAVFSGWTHQLDDSFCYTATFRKEWSQQYQIPFLFSFSGTKQWNTHWHTGFNFSKNFRSPTFNDLFWQPGGNEDLQPEKALNLELTNRWKWQYMDIKFTVFNTLASDLIQWKPISSYVWRPFNIQEVTIYGLEYSFTIKNQLKNHYLQSQFHYSYTVSKDKSLNKQLPYIPNHLGELSLEDNYRKWNFSYDLSYNGKVFTTTSNTLFVSDYWLSDMEISRHFNHKKLKASLAIHNLFNKNYQIVANRPMPNRNYTLNIQFKF